MPLTKQQIWIIAGVGGVLMTSIIIALVVRKLIKNKMNKKVILKGGYVVPKGTPNMADALHSFERRKSDGFGGRMSTKIKEALVKMYENGINPDITSLKVKVDSAKYSVEWEATIEPSKDGKAYTGIMTFGSAGADADSRAKKQENDMKNKIGGKNYALVLDFVNPKGIYIRQYFYKYTRDEYPNLK